MALKPALDAAMEQVRTLNSALSAAPDSKGLYKKPEPRKLKCKLNVEKAMPFLF